LSWGPIYGVDLAEGYNKEKRKVTKEKRKDPTQDSKRLQRFLTKEEAATDSSLSSLTKRPL